MKITRRSFLNCIAAMGAASLVGCDSETSSTSSASSASSSTSAASSEKASIVFWDGNWNEEVFAQIKEIWDAEYPNIELQGEFLVDDGMSDKYVLALQNGTGPDVVSCALDWTTTYGNAGLLAPLDDYIAESGVDTSVYVDGAIAASTIDGELCALPFRSETYTLFYNKDILADAGYTDAPETWDEVLEICKACKTDDISGYGLCGTNYGNYSFQFITMMRSSGSDILSDDYLSSMFDGEVALETAQLYRDLADTAPASMLENDNAANRTLFASGKLAMYMSGIYDIPTILAANPTLNIGCAMAPTRNGADRSTILGGWSVGIANKSDNKDAAWEFVKFITSPEIAAIYTNTFTGTCVASTSLDGVDTDMLQTNADALAYATALPCVANITGIRQAIFDELSPTLSDSKTVEDAVAALHEEVTELLDV